MGSRLIMCVIISFFVGTFSSAAPEAADANTADAKKNEGEVVCAQNSDERKLWIVNENGGCKVNYLKASSTLVIGSQKSGTDFCERLVEKVKTKLISLGFQC